MCAAFSHRRRLRDQDLGHWHAAPDLQDLQTPQGNPLPALQRHQHQVKVLIFIEIISKLTIVFFIIWSPGDRNYLTATIPCRNCLFMQTTYIFFVKDKKWPKYQVKSVYIRNFFNFCWLFSGLITICATIFCKSFYRDGVQTHVELD